MTRSDALHVLTDGQRQAVGSNSRGEVEGARPLTRADCASTPRPCPWISCRHHVADVVADSKGSARAFDLVLTKEEGTEDEAAWIDLVAEGLASLTHSCTLDIAERGEMTLGEVGRVLNVTRERIRQIEKSALARLRGSRRGRTLLQALKR